METVDTCFGVKSVHDTDALCCARCAPYHRCARPGATARHGAL